VCVSYRKRHFRVFIDSYFLIRQARASFILHQSFSNANWAAINDGSSAFGVLLTISLVADGLIHHIARIIHVVSLVVRDWREDRVLVDEATRVDIVLLGFLQPREGQTLSHAGRFIRLIAHLYFDLWFRLR
jgi:hypothetical protein